MRTRWPSSKKLLTAAPDDLDRVFQLLIKDEDFMRNLPFLTNERLSSQATANMAAPFNSDDMIKRSLFGAIFGFNKKSNNSGGGNRSRTASFDDPDRPGPSWASAPSSHLLPSAPLVHPPMQTDQFSAPPLPVLTSQCPFKDQTCYSALAQHNVSHHPIHFSPLVNDGQNYVPPMYQHPQEPIHRGDPSTYKTKADIYREIVHECEEFERSTNTTPAGDSGPTSPTLVPPHVHHSHYGPQPLRSPHIHSPPIQHHQRMSPTTQQWHNELTELTSGLTMLDTPHGHSSAASTAGMHSPTLPFQSPPTMVQPHSQPIDFHNGIHPGMHQDIKPMIAPPISLEELIKYVVHAVKETATGTIVKKENDQDPEEILRRKRQMNNEAAARYRKRQREVKDQQFEELDGLQSRNRQLKRTVQVMEEEIQRLKSAVLESTSTCIAPVPKADE